MSQQGSGAADKIRVRRMSTDEISTEQVEGLRALFDAAWSEKDSEFSDQDWEHSIGGSHFIVEGGGIILSHASVVRRELHTNDRHLETGYVEAVATWPHHQRRGFATAIMLEVGSYIDKTFQLGALDTGSPSFYERLGWAVWRGPTFVRTDAGLLRSREEDGNVLVLVTPTSGDLDLASSISCDWRNGDAW